MPSALQPTRTDRDTRGQTMIGAMLWVLCLEYFLVQAIAVAESSGYSMARHEISYLGLAGCGSFVRAADGAALDICSPGHALFNGGIVLLGALMAGGAILTRAAWPASHAARSGLALLCAGAVGASMVGLWPVDTNPMLHGIGAVLALGIGNVGMGLLGYSVSGSQRWIGGIGLAAGIVSTAAFILYLAHVDFGLGAGTMERVAGYPKTLWLALAGAALLAAALRQRRAGA